MRVDDKTIPDGRWVKVRCPHCQGIGLAGHQTPAGIPSRPGSPVPAAFPQEPSASPAAQVGKGPSVRSPDDPQVFELSLPADAFKDFRFPAEAEIGPTAKREPALGKRILVWFCVSLGIVFVFALLVNLILPGPPK
jgi:hypothetical protein